MSGVELNRVHLQRLRLAVEAARGGARVQFRLNDGEPPTLVWVNRAAPRVQHTIARIYGRKQEWLAAAQVAFEAELNDQYSQTLDTVSEIVSTVRQARLKTQEIR